MRTKYLLTPGPVGLPDKVLRSCAKPLISHRCDDFYQLLTRVEEKLGLLLRSEAPVVILPSSGTGALEALAVNFLDEKSSFISISCGAFGDRFREIALRTKARGKFVDVPPGQALSPEIVADAVMNSGRCELLLLTHNETSTAVVNPVREIVAAIPKERRPLIFIDGVSSVGAMECFPREWGVDGLATASQKGLMTPPGLGFVWLSSRAWEYLEDRQCPSYSFDLKLHRRELTGKQPSNPFTPPVSLYYALETALDIILDYEGGPVGWFATRKRYAEAFSAGLETMGLELFVKEKKYRSPGVTAIKFPSSGEKIRKELRTMGLETAGGQGAMKDALVRIAHYNDCGWAELSMVLGSLYAATGMAETGEANFLREAWNVWNSGR